MKKKLAKSSPKEEKENCEVCDTDQYEFLDLFGLFDLTDQHMTILPSEQELSQRFSDAVETSRRLGFITNSTNNAELGELTRPKLTWQDFSLNTLRKKQTESGRLNWGRPKIKQLFSGFYDPIKETKIAHILLLLDWSASMQKEDITYCLSQTQALGSNCEGWAVCFDTRPFYEFKTKLHGTTLDQLQQISLVGGGGTQLLSTFETYREEIGDVDLILILTDGGIFDLDKLRGFKLPSETQVAWILSNHYPFNPPFGKHFNLK